MATPDSTSFSLADALFTTTQQRVFAPLFTQPHRSFYASELIKLARGGSGQVQRELIKLESSGLVRTFRKGNQKHYQANTDSPVFAELAAIAEKTFGLAEPLKLALQPLASNIEAAFVFGSVAKQSDTASSDIDVFIVSETLGYFEVFNALLPVGARLKRQVNPTILTSKELKKRLKDGSAFVTRVTEQPKIWLVGSEHALRT